MLLIPEPIEWTDGDRVVSGGTPPPNICCNQTTQAAQPPPPLLSPPPHHGLTVCPLGSSSFSSFLNLYLGLVSLCV